MKLDFWILEYWRNFQKEIYQYALGNTWQVREFVL